VAEAFKDLAYVLGQLSQSSELASPVSHPVVPVQGEDWVGCVGPQAKDAGLSAWQ
jgi:hypothetical protein